MERIVALIDMDCFYVQVEQRLNPDLIGKPCAVVQYNSWRGGGLIAVSYEARDAGVGRHIRGDDAQKICPEIVLVRVPEVNGKADLTKYRDAGKEVIDVISQFANCIERASVDEAYIDLTEEVKNVREQQISLDQLKNTYVEEWEDPDESTACTDNKENMRIHGLMKLLECEEDEITNLLAGAKIVENIRAAILEKTGFKCSAGISHNKILSKLACGINKPNKQTIIPNKSVHRLFAKTAVKKVRNLGGKLGDLLQDRGIVMMSDINKYSEKELQKQFGDKNGNWLFQLAQGMDNEPVKSRQLPQSIGCSKLFNGMNALTTIEQVNMWLKRLAAEIEMRLEKDRTVNNRIATLLCLHINLRDEAAPVSRSCPLPNVSATRIATTAHKILSKMNKSTDNISWSPAITSLGMAATKFKSIEGTSATLMEKFIQTKTDKREPSENDMEDNELVKLESNNQTSPSKIQLNLFATNKPITHLLKQQASAAATKSVRIQDYGAIAIKLASAPTESDTLKSDDSNQSLKDLNSVFKNDSNTNDDEMPSTSSGFGKRFLPQSPNSNDLWEKKPSDDEYLCDKCQKLVSVWDQMEHEDFHFAEQIQSELKASNAGNAVARAPARSPPVKRKSKKTHKNGPAVKTRNISSYFKIKEPTNN